MTVRPTVSAPRGLDRDMEPARGDDHGIDKRSHTDRIVHRGAARLVHPLDLVMNVDAVADELRRRLAGRRAERRELLAILVGHERPMSCVERDERHFAEACREHHRRRFGIDPDVELGRGRDIADLVSAAHDDDLRHPLDELGIERERRRDVGQRCRPAPG